MRLPLVTKTLLALAIVLSTTAEIFKIWKIAHHTLNTGGSDHDTPDDAIDPPNLDAYLIVLVVGKTPGWLLPFTLVTTSMVETQLVPFLILLLMLATGGRYCEKVWGSKRYLAFASMLLLGSTLLELFLFGIFGSTVPPSADSGPTTICGANGLVAGITVALKQQVPAHTVVLLRGKVRIPLQWAPIIFLGAVSLLRVLGLEENLTAYYVGFVASWFYLRFIERDASDAFAFANFFPEPVAGAVVEPACNFIFKLVSRAGPRAVPVFTSEEIHDSNQKHVARLIGTALPVFNTPTAPGILTGGSGAGSGPGAVTGAGVQATNERRNMMLRQLDTVAP